MAFQSKEKNPEETKDLRDRDTQEWFGGVANHEMELSVHHPSKQREIRWKLDIEKRGRFCFAYGYLDFIRKIKRVVGFGIGKRHNQS